MASFVQPIQTYKIHLVHNRTAGSPTTHSRNRYLVLQFTLPGTNKPSEAQLIFIADAQWASTGDITKLDNQCYQVIAKIPAGEFATYYDLVRNEQPVSIWVDYGTEPGLKKTVPIINFSLFSGEEPLGEGPKDTSL